MNRLAGTIERIPEATDAQSVPSPSMSPGQWVMSLAELTASFTRWLDDRADEERVWPAFDRFIRETLLDLVGATRVRVFRTVDGGRGLRPLAEEPGGSSGTVLPTGLLDHILGTGRRYIRGDWTHGALVDQLAAESGTSETGIAVPCDQTVSDERHAAADAHGSAESGAPAWAFPIRSRGRRVSRGEGTGAMHSVGLVVVGELLEQHLAARDGLEALAHLINGFWLHVRDFESLQMARRTDRGSGVLNRMDFLDAAETAASEADREGEPVVVMAAAIEGLRRLDDDGHWTVRDRLIQEAGRVLRRRLRNDDLVGRFSDDRFVVLLRWLDLSLGKLIAGKVIQSLRDVVAEVLREEFPEGGKDYLRVRCGLASSRTGDVRRGGADTRDNAARATGEGRISAGPTLNELLVGALCASATARRNGQEICIAGVTDRPSGVSPAPARGQAGVETSA